MDYESTKGLKKARFSDVIKGSLAPDGGLWVPSYIPSIPRAFFNNITDMSLRDIAYVTINTLLGSDIPSKKLKAVVDESFECEIPLKKLDGGDYVMELFHSPTLAYKDFSARFTAALYRTLFPENFTVLVATTGNTGAAIAYAFQQVPQANIVVLYPNSSLAPDQRAQYAGLSGNVILAEVAGTYSDCKHLVACALADKELNARIPQIGVNTINLLRVLPQVAFFFYGYSVMKSEGLDADRINFSIPCGNLSNLTASVIAKRMGLPFNKLIAACTNDDLVKLLSGIDCNAARYNTDKPTVAWAMDVGRPVNIPRLMHLYGNFTQSLQDDIIPVSVDNDEIGRTMAEIYRNYSYTVDPHTALALAAARRANLPGPTIALATAHPAKSADIVGALTGHTVRTPYPHTIHKGGRNVLSCSIRPSYNALKELLESQ